MAAISMIVPVYKVEAYLDRCVGSILRQTFDDFELILVDDGSPDNCGALCDGYAREDARVRVIHRENGGLSAARNSAIDLVLSEGVSQWLLFADSDDWIHPWALETLYRAVQETGCRISAGGFFDTQGEEIPLEQDCSVTVLSADDYYCGNFHHNGTPTAWNKLYHISLFENLRYPQGKLHEDEFTTYIALYAAGQVAATQAQLYAYYHNPQSITRAGWNPRRMDALEAVEQQIAFAQRTGNRRLLQTRVEAYLFGAADQLRQAEADYQDLLRQKLRTALKLGRALDGFPGIREMHWAYELAYPCKPLWWLMSHIWK